jgi:hypothetical protein
MSVFHQAIPVKLVNADEERISFIYFLSGGDYDSKFVLVSSVITPNYEETAVFICDDSTGEEAEWDNILAKINYVDTEEVLNKMGYTTKVPT